MEELLNTATYSFEEIESGKKPQDFVGTSEYRWLRVTQTGLYPSLTTYPSEKTYPKGEIK